MTVLNKKIRRDVIPRWRLSVSKPDFDSFPARDVKKQLSSGPQQDPISYLDEFIKSGKLLVGAEALSVSISLGDNDVALRVANELKKFDLSGLPALADRVKKFLERRGERSPDEEIQKKEDIQIRRLKRIVRGYPRSPLAWLDLAFSYAANGYLSRAEKAVSVAISLEPNHRGIVRSASRFFVHKGEIDRALAVISKSGLVRTDPWLVSAHIATARAGGFTSNLIGAGRKMFKNENFRPDQVSELGAALATNELEHGNVRLAQKLVGKAMRAPTENAVAQVAWLETTGKTDFSAAEIVSRVPAAWEARTFELYERKEWRASCEQAQKWLHDQPFSSRPAIHGSFVAATFLEDYALSLVFAESGYRANPTDIVLANNYAVALAENDRVADAKRVFADALRGQDSVLKWTLRATEGLLLYRDGDVEGGRAAYDDARVHFSEIGDKRSEILATVFQAREESRLGNYVKCSELIGPLVSESHQFDSFESDALRLAALKVDLNA